MLSIFSVLALLLPKEMSAAHVPLSLLEGKKNETARAAPPPAPTPAQDAPSQRRPLWFSGTQQMTDALPRRDIFCA